MYYCSINIDDIFNIKLYFFYRYCSCIPVDFFFIVSLQCHKKRILYIPILEIIKKWSLCLTQSNKVLFYYIQEWVRIKSSFFKKIKQRLST